MNILKSILLGLVQGLTEFLPVSSSGHLAIFGKILGTNLDSEIYFNVLLHLGTLIAIIIVFHEDIWHMIQEFFQMLLIIFANFIVFIKRRRGDTKYTYFKVVNSNYKKLVLMIIISTIPTGLIGLLDRNFTELATNTLWFVGICLMITSGILMLADKKSDNTMKINKAKYSDAYFIGVAQGVATLPGISRSGATIATGMMLGFNKQLAIKYSFLMSIPAVLGAVIVELAGNRNVVFGSADLPGYVLGTITAAVSGYFAIKFMLRLIKNKSYKGFSIYCIIAGVAGIILSFIK